MKESVPTAAAAALDELLEVSPQVDAAVILERDGGELVASAPESAARSASKLGAVCVRILAAAEQSRRELGREPVAQVEVGTPDGHVFVVGDSSWIVAAVTDADPTVGLVFYDLKTALRAVREAAPATAPEDSSNGATPASIVTTSTGDEPATDAADGAPAPTSSGDDAGASTEPAGAASKSPEHGTSISRRWRRRNR